MKTRLAPAIAYRMAHPLLKGSLVTCLWLGLSGLPLAAQTEVTPTEESEREETDAGNRAAPASTETVTSPLQTSSRPSLRLGSEGDYVIELQALLRLLGYYTGTIDGLYREDTVAAVSAFQEAAGLEADGVVGPATWNRLLPAVPVTRAAAPEMTVTASAAATEASSAVMSPETTTNTSNENASPTTTPSAEANAESAPAAATSAAASTPDVSETSAATPTPASPQAEPSPAATTSGSSESSATAASSDATRSGSSASTASTSASDPVAFPILRIGMYGPAVIQLQERLRSLGVYEGAVDGVFGPETQRAVKAAQQRNQLAPDGVVGPATWSALFR